MALNIKVGDIAVIKNDRLGLLNCPIVHVSRNRFIVIQLPEYRTSINLTKDGNVYEKKINDFNTLISFKKGESL